MMRAAMRRRWVLAAVVLAALAVGVSTGLGGASRSARVPGPRAFLGPHLARLEAVLVFGGRALDYRLDQGRIVGVGGDAIRLREREGARERIAVAADARVLLDGRDATLAQLQTGMWALTVRLANGPAQTVRARTRLLP